MSNAKKIIPKVLLFVLCSLMLFLYSKTTFIQQSHFIDLTAQEKKVLLTTENAFYYRFYDDLTNLDSPSFQKITGFTKRSDIEAGRTINVIQRFNIYPEIFFAWNYNSWGKKIESDSMLFYFKFIFFMNALTLGFIFLLASGLSKSNLLGIFAAFLYLANYDQISRVNILPPLRENIGILFVIMGHLANIYFFREKKVRYLLFIGVAIFLRAITWQFSQVLNIFDLGFLSLVYIFEFLEWTILRKYLLTFVIAHVLAVLLMFGNQMYLFALPLWMSLVWLVLGYFISENKIRRFQRLAIIIGSTLIAIIIKKSLEHIFSVQQDGHIFDFFLKRFMGIDSFNGNLYALNSAFMTLPWQSISYLSESLLLPMSFFSFFFLLFYWRKEALRVERSYLIIQFLAALILASMAVRFLLLLCPLLIIWSVWPISLPFFPTASFLKNKIADKVLFVPAIIFIVVSIYQGQLRIKENLTAHSKYKPIVVSTQYLANYINNFVQPNAVIFTMLGTSAEMELLTHRTAVLHPQYEDFEIRKRTKDYFTLYGNADQSRIQELQAKYKFTHVILLSFLCNDQGWQALPALAAPPVAVPRSLCNDFDLQSLFNIKFKNDDYLLLEWK